MACSPKSIDTKYLLTIPAFREFYRSGAQSEPDGNIAAHEPAVVTPEEVIEAAYNGLRSAFVRTGCWSSNGSTRISSWMNEPEA